MSQDNIEDIYPLSPMQQGMLFHSLYSPEAGMYLSQLTCAFSGLNASAFEQAWQQVINRHSIFRTAFIWEGLDEPVQVAFRRIGLQAERLDWRDKSERERKERLAAYLEGERRRGFDYREAPLMRIALIQLDEATHQFVWTYHHMLMDAWSESLVMTELMLLYLANCEGQTAELEPTRPYGDYIAWLARQDVSESERFWRQALKGLAAPAPIKGSKGSEESVNQEPCYSEARTTLSEEETAALQRIARRNQLTLNTMVQGAWALLLSHYSGSRDIVFGVNVSGRPSSLPGVESIAGIFINTLPVRVKVSPHSSLQGWLKELQDWQAEMRQYEYSPLAQVQMWSEIPRGQPLFESILVFQNAPVPALAQRLRNHRDQLQIRNVKFQGGWTNYPLALDAKPAAEMVLNLSYDRRRFGGSDAKQMVAGLKALLLTFIDKPRISLDRLLEILGALDKQQQIEKAKEMEAANLEKLRQVRRKTIRATAAP
jgi:Condensation domain